MHEIANTENCWFIVKHWMFQTFVSKNNIDRIFVRNYY